MALVVEGIVAQWAASHPAAGREALCPNCHPECIEHLEIVILKNMYIFETCMKCFYTFKLFRRCPTSLESRLILL